MRVTLSNAVPVFLLCLMGCSGRVAGQAENSARAKYILITALESWKSGQVESLSTRDPAIRFADHDQKAGIQLVDYEIENEAAAIKPFENVRVNLVVKDKQGATSQKSVTYQVGVEPRLTVLRSDN